MKKELIVARYNENIDWVYEVDASVESIIVYNKGKNLISKDSRVRVVELNNTGREAHTYIHHFLHNRNRLADITFTSQGNPFEHSPDFINRLAVDYDTLKSLSIRYTVQWPLENVTSKDMIEFYKGFEIRYGDMNYFGHRDAQTTRLWFEKMWKMMFVNPVPNDYYYGYSAMWAIPKGRILVRSHQFWMYFYEILSHQYSIEAYSCSIDAWGFEAMWHAIFTPSYTARL